MLEFPFLKLIIIIYFYCGKNIWHEICPLNKYVQGSVVNEIFLKLVYFYWFSLYIQLYKTAISLFILKQENVQMAP